MRLQTVYVVTFNIRFEGSDVEGVFSSYDKAVEHIKSVDDTLTENNNGEWVSDASNDYFEIEGMQVDVPVE